LPRATGLILISSDIAVPGFFSVAAFARRWRRRRFSRAGALQAGGGATGC
jgi:hypothetical protein